MTRALCIVLDSVGCGGAPDAAEYGDSGANTLGHLYERIAGFSLPHLESLGLGRLLNLAQTAAPTLPAASSARLTAHAAGKDTTSGHWELMGHALESPFETHTAFPEAFVRELSRRTGTSFLGNLPASGTEILDRLGPEHLRSGQPILYTSADSVLQLAAHEEHFGLERLWEICQIARNLLDERGMRVGCVIARPFVGDRPGHFQRTANRHDYSMQPGETALNRLQRAGIRTVGVGKIADIFANSGIDESHPTRSNTEGMETIAQLWQNGPAQAHFILANLVDFDSLHGHRRDPAGYADCLRAFDRWLGTFLPQILPGDLLLITADHGNDPYHPGTDHTREQVPALSLGTRQALADGPFGQAAHWIESHLLASTTAPTAP